jgi:hypothetical protein
LSRKKVNSSFFFYALGGIPTCQLFPSLSFSSCYGRCLFSALYPSSTLYLRFFYQWTEQPKMRAATNKLPMSSDEETNTLVSKNSPSSSVVQVAFAVALWMSNLLAWRFTTSGSFLNWASATQSF